jgi:hypothetical protein
MTVEERTRCRSPVEPCDRQVQSIRSLACIIIAAENPLYVGCLLIDADALKDKSDLIVWTLTAQWIFDGLEHIAECADITGEHGELFLLFDDLEMMTNRRVHSEGHLTELRTQYRSMRTDRA